jgi:hypothetical protein
MNSLKPIRLRPTFPIDAVAIERLKYEAIWNSPRLWLPWLAAKVASVFHSNEPNSVQETTGLLDWAIRNWQSHDNDLTADIIKRMIQDSNRQQDSELLGLIAQLRQAGCPQYAISVGKLLLLKQHIEEQLHAAGELTERKQSLERLIDSLCDQVCQQIHHLAQLDGRLGEVLTSRDPAQLESLAALREAGHRRVMDAYGSLYDAAQHLPLLLNPAQVPRDPSQSNLAALDRLIGVLREEYDLSRKVQDRIRHELPDLERMEERN